MKPVFKIVPGAGPDYKGTFLNDPGRNQDTMLKQSH